MYVSWQIPVFYVPNIQTTALQQTVYSHLQPDFGCVQGESDQVGHTASCSSRKDLDSSRGGQISSSSTSHDQWLSSGDQQCKQTPDGAAP